MNASTNLIRTRAALALALTAMEASAAALARGRDIHAKADAEAQRHVAAATDADESFAGRLAAAIEAGDASPAFITDASADQARLAAERQARAAAAAVKHLEQAHVDAQAAHREVMAATQRAADEVLNAQALDLITAIRGHQDEVNRLANQLSSYAGGYGHALPCDHEIVTVCEALPMHGGNNMHVPVNILRSMERDTPSARTPSRLAEMRRELIEAAPATATEQPRAA
jgi:hypothetical protein